jgi:2-C-methyl-D-erythritol 2,4-cyclodiphosphate synthase
MIRTGMGYDVHRLAENRKLILGGVDIPYVKGLMGHSDADVVLHAVCDAILGAMGAGDIGRYFPDTDPEYKNICSKEILRQVAAMASEARYRIVNLDVTVISEEVKISPFREPMKDAIAGILGIEREFVNIKATTTEGIDSIGRNEAIASYANVLIERQ